MTQWLENQLEVARELIGQGSQGLRQQQVGLAQSMFSETQAVLDMAEAENPDDEEALDILELRAQLLNELGVVHQRADEPDEALERHREAAEICEQLLEAGREFRGNAAATKLNYASMASALERYDEARRANSRAIELIDELVEEGEGGVETLALGAHAGMAIMEGQTGNFDVAEEAMERAVSFADDLVEGGGEQFAVNAAQSCQQFSVMCFHAGERERALRWGEEAERFSVVAYEAIGGDVLQVYVISEANLISYHEQLGHFAEAEDSLWKAIEVAGNDPTLLRRGREFYNHCRKMADARLRDGNLPREEVEEGLADLQELIEEIGGLPEPEEEPEAMA